MSIERALRDGLTVSDLIAELKNMDQDAKVVFAYDYGDHIHSTVCPAVHTVDEGSVKWSEYHRMPKLMDEDAEANDKTKVVILNLSN